MFHRSGNSTRRLLQAGAVAVICCSIAGAAAAKGKPQANQPLWVDMVGGLEPAEAEQSHEVSVGKQQGSSVLEVVVRNFDLSFPFGEAAIDGGGTCFAGSDEGAAGKFILFDDGTSEFQAYPEYLDKDGGLQVYELILNGSHDLGPVEDFPATGPVSFEATFNSIQVSTEGRGGRRNACTGTFGPGDGFEATASFDR